MHFTPQMRWESLMFCLGIIVYFGVSKGDVFRSPCRNDALFKMTDRDKKLSSSSSILVSEFASRGLSFCAKTCTHNSRCSSINYKIFTSSSEKNCQILNAVKATSGTSLNSAMGWNHYEAVNRVSPKCQFVTCSPGYECKNDCNKLEGYTCIDINECLSNPCKNGGTCLNEINKYACTCLPFFIQPICESNYVSVTTRSTNFGITDRGYLEYLDRHYPNCGSNSFIRGFRLETSGTNIRYYYECINLKQSLCTTSVKHGSDQDHGSGTTHHIDRFPADCGTDGYMSGFLFEKSTYPLSRYHLNCCNVGANLQSSVSCYSGSTTSSDNGGTNSIFHLDRHQVWCNSGYALSYFWYLNTNGYTQFQLQYRCCKLYA